MKTVLVAGAAGAIGQCAVRALLERGAARVIATSRSAERLQALREHIDPAHRERLTTLEGDAGDFAGAARIVARVEALGGADVAIASLGRGWWTGGPLLAMEPADWESVLAEMLTAHFAFARAAVPMLARRAGSTYLSLGGGAAFAPVRDAGLMSVAAAGQAMLTRVLAREAGSAPPRILELVIDGPANTRESRHFAEATWIRDDDAGAVVAELALTGKTTWLPVHWDGPLVVMEERTGS